MVDNSAVPADAYPVVADPWLGRDLFSKLCTGVIGALLMGCGNLGSRIIVHWRMISAMVVPCSLVMLLAACGPTDRFVILEDTLNDYSQEDPELYSGVSVVTDEHCPDAPDDCIEAVNTDQALYVKYPGDDEAQKWMDENPDADARRTGWIVITYHDPNLPDDKRQYIYEGIEGIHEDVEGTPVSPSIPEGQ